MDDYPLQQQWEERRARNAEKKADEEYAASWEERRARSVAKYVAQQEAEKKADEERYAKKMADYAAQCVANKKADQEFASAYDTRRCPHCGGAVRIEQGFMFDIIRCVNPDCKWSGNDAPGL